jgi:hypothetical protein
MRSLSAALFALLSIICPCLAATDFSGSWAIDLTTYSFRTKDGKNASLIIKRKLTEAGASLVLTNTMHVEGEPQKWVVERVWRKRESP